MYFVPQPPSSYFDHPLDCIVLCSFVSDFTPILNEDRSIDEVVVAQPTCAGIHEEYDWELEHPLEAKDHPYLSVPPPFFLDLIGDPAILDFSCVSSSTKAPIVDHS